MLQIAAILRLSVAVSSHSSEERIAIQDFLVIFIIVSPRKLVSDEDFDSALDDAVRKLKKIEGIFLPYSLFIKTP